MSLWDPIQFDAETIEAAVALCSGLGDADVSAFATAVLPLAYDDVEARLDLARATFFEVYKRRTPCWIYFAQVGVGDVVKVGRSTAVAKRMVALTRQHGVAHNLLGTARGDYREERQIHSYFRNHRLNNLEGGVREYFRLEPLRSTIDAILAAGKLIELPLRPLP